jgi:hypothetical protein
LILVDQFPQRSHRLCPRFRGRIRHLLPRQGPEATGIDGRSCEEGFQCILIRARLRDELPETAAVTVTVSPATTRVRDDGTASLLAMLDEIAVKGANDPATVNLVKFIHGNLREG